MLLVAVSSNNWPIEQQLSKCTLIYESPLVRALHILRRCFASELSYHHNVSINLSSKLWSGIAHTILVCEHSSHHRLAQAFWQAKWCYQLILLCSITTSDHLTLPLCAPQCYVISAELFLFGFGFQFLNGGLA